MKRFAVKSVYMDNIMAVCWEEFLPELWSIVCIFLSYDDIKNVRLVSKQFSDNPYIFPFLFRKVFLMQSNKNYIGKNNFHLLNTTRILTLLNYFEDVKKNYHLLKHVLKHAGVISLRIHHGLIRQLLANQELLDLLVNCCRTGRIKVIKILLKTDSNEKYHEIRESHSNSSITMTHFMENKLADYTKKYFGKFFTLFCGNDCSFTPEKGRRYGDTPRYRLYRGSKGSMMVQLSDHHFYNICFTILRR